MNLKAPNWFDKYAKYEWKRIIKILQSESKDFTEKDIKSLEGYCMSYSTWRRCEEEMLRTGMTFETPNKYRQQVPEVSIAKNAQSQMLSFMKELGLTPAARARMNKNKSASSTEGYSDEDREMEEMFHD